VGSTGSLTFGLGNEFGKDNRRWREREVAKLVRTEDGLVNRNWSQGKSWSRERTRMGKKIEEIKGGNKKNISHKLQVFKSA